MKNALISIIFLSLGITGCTSYYSSAILSHEEVNIPQPEFEDSGDHDGGFFLKTCPTTSQYTSDYTHSLQAGYMHSLTIPAGDYCHVQMAGVLSGYGALTYIKEYYNSEEYEMLMKSSYGFTGQGKIGFYTGGKGKFYLGADGLYNFERGEYRDYRKDMAEEDLYTEDLSPRGESLFFSVSSGFLMTLEESRSVLFKLGYGYAYPNLFYDDYSPYYQIKTSVTYRDDFLWVWAGIEKFSYLNIGLNGGVGFFLY